MLFWGWYSPSDTRKKTKRLRTTNNKARDQYILKPREKNVMKIDICLGPIPRGLCSRFSSAPPPPHSRDPIF